jgi:hypothetical protein
VVTPWQVGDLCWVEVLTELGTITARQAVVEGVKRDRVLVRAVTPSGPRFVVDSDTLWPRDPDDE